jgi:hypothetical protein
MFLCCVLMKFWSLLCDTTHVQVGIHGKSKGGGENTVMSSVSFTVSMVYKRFPTTIP